MRAAEGQRAPIDGAAVWHARDVADATEWTIELSAGQRAEISASARAASSAGRTIATLTVDDFPLTGLVDVLRSIVHDLAHGRGFALLRGFPVDLLDEHEIELAYAGLGLHLGTPVSQDAAGTLLGHVRDEGVERTGPEVRLYRTRQRQDFHTDGADIIGLLCLRRARSGGESKLASSYAVYNEILRRRPDLMDVLYEPMWWDRNGEETPGDDPAFPMPIFHDVGGMPRIFYIGWYIRDAQRHAMVPPLTTPQREALELIEAIANDPTFHVVMDFEPGDVQLLNNAKILHSREAYEDDVDPAQRRHLLRLWLSAHDFNSVEERLRSGIPKRQIPIACTLDGDDLPARLAAWREVLEAAQGRMTSPDGSVRLELGTSYDLGTLAALVAAEQQCCAFFSFAITVDRRGVGLEVSAPDGAQALVAELFGLPDHDA